MTKICSDTGFFYIFFGNIVIKFIQKFACFGFLQVSFLICSMSGFAIEV